MIKSALSFRKGAFLLIFLVFFLKNAVLLFKVRKFLKDFLQKHPYFGYNSVTFIDFYSKI